MKKEYKGIEIEVIAFENADVIENSGEDKGEEDETTAITGDSLHVPSPRPLGETGSLRQRPHPGVVSLPGEISEGNKSGE